MIANQIVITVVILAAFASSHQRTSASGEKISGAQGDTEIDANSIDLNAGTVGVNIINNVADRQDGTRPTTVPTTDDQYLIGAGIADMTGPAADINLMGYAKPGQDAAGIHLRQFSRAIIVVDKYNSRVVYVGTDAGMISQPLRHEVIKKLRQKYANLYTENNVMMSASHTHSCPGGYFQYLLYNIPSQGFISQTLEAMVNGIVRSIDRAHANLQLGRMSYAEGQLVDASINRSPTSYEQNPATERQMYQYNTDKQMVVVKMTNLNGEPIAMLNWFAVHGTSMNNTNHLISSDNKGYASILFEHDHNPDSMPGKGKFVAIFAQANEGDVSPNTEGPRCIDTGLPCDSVTSTCGNPPRNERCVAFGPGRDMFESTKIIAHRQYAKARQLFDDQSKQIAINGPVRFVHQYVDMSEQVLPMGNTTVRTCKPALGYSFAAGTTDGPGAFDFAQGDTNTSPFWNMVRDFVRKPSPEQSLCHHPKPILLATGEMSFPYAWQPSIVPTQIFTLGQLAIVALPGEFTTMSGRRVRNAVESVLNSAQNTPTKIGLDRTKDSLQQVPLSPTRAPANRIVIDNDTSNRGKYIVVLSGLSNIYTSYVATYEEYQMQRYEGASTLYGPHTLEAYIRQFTKLAASVAPNGQPIDSPGPEPPNLLEQQITLRPGVIYDWVPFGHHFGDCIDDVSTDKVYLCTETVRASFISGHPRNDLRQEDTYMLVEMFNNDTQLWQTIATDASWDTKFIWQRTNSLIGESRATLEWTIPHDCRDGLYRFQYFGASKNLMQQIKPYQGQSSVFRVASHRYGSTTKDLNGAPAAASVVSASIQSTIGSNNNKQPAQHIGSQERVTTHNDKNGLNININNGPSVSSSGQMTGGVPKAQSPRQQQSALQALASFFGIKL